jgi:hypothetical protein
MFAAVAQSVNEIAAGSVKLPTKQPRTGCTALC